MPVATNFEAPFVATSIDPSGATETTARPKRVMLAGYRLATGALAEGVLYQVTSDADGVTNSGRGSMLAAMCKAFRDVNPLTELWALGIDNPGGGVAAEDTLTLTGTATETAPLVIAIDGEEVSISVVSGDAAAAVATDVTAAITALPDLIVTASDTTGVVTFVNRHLAVMDTRFRVVSVPAGLTAVFASSVSSSGVAASTVVTDALSNKNWDWIVFGLTGNLGSFIPEIATALESRWGELAEYDDMAMFATAGYSFATLSTVTAAPALNSPYITYVDPESPSTETAAHVTAAQVAAADMAKALENTPRQWTVLPDVQKGYLDNSFTSAERSLLIGAGATTLKLDASDRVVIDRLVTTYQQNSAGSPDKAYQNVATMKTLRYARWDWRRRITTKYPDYLLGDDGATAQPGVKIMTPNTMRAEAVSWFDDMAALGLFDSSSKDAFIEAITVWRPNGTTVRLDAITQPTFLSPFLQSNHTIAFKL